MNEMLQQINLYKFLTVKSRFQLTWRMALYTYAFFILFFIFIYGIEFRQKWVLMRQYTALNNQVTVLENRLRLLLQQYPVSNENTLTNENHSLQHQLLKETKILNLLTSNKDFSSYLTALGNLDIYNIWLTEIMLNNTQQNIVLKGFALRSELVEQMLIQLGRQPAFSSLKFEVQNITENPLPPSFEISARQASFP